MWTMSHKGQYWDHVCGNGLLKVSIGTMSMTVV